MLVPQLVALFRKVWKGMALLTEVCYWRWDLRVRSLALIPVISALILRMRTEVLGFLFQLPHMLLTATPSHMMDSDSLKLSAQINSWLRNAFLGHDVWSQEQEKKKAGVHAVVASGESWAGTSADWRYNMTLWQTTCFSIHQERGYYTCSLLTCGVRQTISVLFVLFVCIYYYPGTREIQLLDENFCSHQRNSR